MYDKSTEDLEKELLSCTLIHSFLEEHQSFMSELPISELLKECLEKKSLTRTEVIAASGLNEIYAHQIFSGKRKPSRDKLLCLCFGLGLTLDQVQEMLRDCGYATLFVKRRRDCIIMHALNHKMNLLLCNKLLTNENEELLG